MEERYPWMLFRGEQIIRGSFKESQNPTFLETIKERITKGINHFTKKKEA